MNLIIIGLVIVSVIVIGLVLMQDRSSGVGGAFGGGSGGGEHQVRRGAEKFLYITTIVSVILFAGLAILNLVLYKNANPVAAPEFNLEAVTTPADSETEDAPTSH